MCLQQKNCIRLRIEQQFNATIMSSDVDDEQVLPESLQKLEIVPVYSQPSTSYKLSNDQNPFYAVLDADVTDMGAYSKRIEKLFGPTCSNCGNNENGGSMKDTNKSSRHSNRGNNVNQNYCMNGNNEHGIQRQIHFKQRDKEKSQIFSERKLLILREPILKSIGRSIHHNHNRHSMRFNESCTIEDINGGRTQLSDENLDDQILADGDTPILVSNNSSNNLNSLSFRNRSIQCIDANVDLPVAQNWQLKNECPIDFKSLVNDCSNMSLSSTLDAGGDVDNQSTFHLHRTKNFQTLQSNEMVSMTANNVNSSINGMNSSMSSTTSSNSSSSCSQQARMNSSNCDVTIDELASYFETFVHIPKKMSSMAEMMYI